MDNPAVASNNHDVYFRPRPGGELWPRVRSMLNGIGMVGMTAATLGHARRVAPFQVEYSTVSMLLPRLSPAFEGFRIVQLSDLHVGTTPPQYLRRVIAEVNRMPRDLVVITGDFVTSSDRYVDLACRMVSDLGGPVIASLGNHDYAPKLHEPWISQAVANALERGLRSCGITLLRNRAAAIERVGERIWIVGLEDLWSTLFDPHKAFADVDVDEPVIALSHNPDTAHFLEPFGADWILAGHTHGGQIRLPLAGALVLPMEHKDRDAGFFRIGRSRLYVSRGVGFHRQVRFRCPPEVTTFVLGACRGGEPARRWSERGAEPEPEAVVSG